jgi:surface protein
MVSIDLWIDTLFVFNFNFFTDHVSIVLSISGGGTAFASAAAFNADISKWETGKVTHMAEGTITSVPHLFMNGLD